MTDRRTTTPVAIVGMAVLLPGAADLAAYWRNLVDGTDAITDVPEGRWDAEFYRPEDATASGPGASDRVYCRRGGFVDDLAEVEVTRFGIMPNSVSGTEPDQLIALNVAASAIADAGGEERLPDRHRIGVVLGRGGYLTPGLVRLDQRVRTAHQLVRTLGELLPDLGAEQLDRVREAFTDRLGPDRPESAIGLVPNLAASRVANRLDLRGPAYTVDAACASSLIAVDQAVGELASGRCDLMLAGGVHHCHDITLWSVFSQLRALSPSQRIRPFHRGADGILIGEGTGVVVLKRLADAERDGDRIYAVIRGTGVASDGRSGGLVSPDPGGQTQAVRQAWRAAGLDPAAPGSIGLLEAHGTATPAGDAAELTTLADVFGPAAEGDRPVIGSVKSMIGHTMPAAGVAGLVKAALAVHHGLLLPTLHCDDPHPALAATRFRTIGTVTPWGTAPDQPIRRAAVNAFGFGGINAHVVLEQAPDTRPRLASAGAVRGGVPAAAGTYASGAARLPAPEPLPGVVPAAVSPLGAAASAVSRGTVPAPAVDPVRGGVSAAEGMSASGAVHVPGPPAPPASPGVVPGPAPVASPAPVDAGAVSPRGAAPLLTSPVPEPPAPAGAPAPRRTAAVVAEPERVLRLAAGTPEQLARLLDADDPTLLAAAGENEGPAGRTRLGIVDPTAKRLALARRVVAKGRAWRGRSDVWFAPRPLLGGDSGGKLAFVFPGLEGEFEPRVNDVAQHFGLPRPGSDRPGGQAAVGDIGRHGAGVVGIGRLLDAALRRMGVVPDAVAGHSVGEWTAMVAGGLYSGDAVDDFMESFDPDSLTVPGLAFAVVGTSAERVLAALAERADDSIVLSHDNAPNQSMVCGPARPVEEFVRSFRAQGVLSQVLPFQSGFHTPMLAPYLGPIRAAANRFELRPATVPVWSGTTASPYPAGAAEVRALFVRHLLEPVRFRSLAEAMHAAGFRAFVQVGTGQLGSLIGDTLADRDHLVVAANSPHRDGLAQLRRVATALWAEGLALPATLPMPPSRTRRPSLPAVEDSTSVAGAAAAPAARRPPPVRLDLGGALVSLDERTLAGLRAGLAQSRTGTPGTAPSPRSTEPLPALSGSARTGPTPVGGAASALDAVAVRFPAAAELSALLRDTADTAAVLIAASGRPGRPPAPARHRPPARPSAGLPEGPRPGPGPTPGEGHRTVVRVSPDTMPYLLDHCFFPQRPGWPDVADRWPVVPATTIVHHLMDAAEQAAPGLRAVAVHGARFDQWLTATPAVDVPVTAVPDGPGRFAVSFGPRARGVVELAARHPATPPAPWRTDPATERTPDLEAAELYSGRWMFHGPAFQGITELTAIGEAHVRAMITAPSAPGALLDNVGQVLGYWIMATRTERTVVFPVQMRHMRFYGPHPRPGTELECVIRIVSLTDTVLEADAQLVSPDGTVWADISGWQDRRFDNDPETKPVERFPERNTLSRARPGGWSLLHERWPDLASRDLIMRNSLGGDERAEYERHPPRGRRQWLLGRIAAKDAVRQWLWDHGEGPVFPAEIRVHNDEHGRPYVTGTHGRTLPELDLSLAHRAEAGVAIVRPRRRTAPGRPGIDIEEVAERGEETLAVALGARELELLRARCAATGEPRALWFTRFWAAKEAVAKAEGTGLRGQPRDFTVTGAEPDRLLVEAAGRTYRVRCEPTTNPPGLPERDYVVAWTTDWTTEEQQ